MQLTMLGVGASSGTPVLGCQCNTCISTNQKNKRTRCSSLITLDTGENILIDTGPDLRQQFMREQFMRVDAVLYTHSHADHMNGIDDLRAFCQLQKAQIPLYANEVTTQHILDRFGYALREPSNFWDVPILKANIVCAPFDLFGVKITPIPVMHGRVEILGYRINNMAYLTDVSAIPESSMPLLEGLELLCLDSLRHTPHPTHIHLEQSLALAGQINAKSTYLIHMTHDLEYETLVKTLPEHVYPGFDGLKIQIQN